mmetsp:Transcript_5214/g.19590  ORF Transcript_5214/g.19590 Transcript_5214/m.19590 type:complete len:236 (+) Transcript_5214:1634-2341(+)
MANTSTSNVVACHVLVQAPCSTAHSKWPSNICPAGMSSSCCTAHCGRSTPRHVNAPVMRTPAVEAFSNVLVRSVLHIPCCSGIAAQRSSASCKALVANSRTPGKTPSASSWARATRPSTALKTGTNDSTTACKGNEIFKATASRSKRIKFPTWNFATFRASPAEPCRKSGWPDMGAPKAATSAAAAAWAASSTAARETAASHAASRQRSFKKRQARFCRGREPSNSATRVRVRHS